MEALGILGFIFGLAALAKLEALAKVVMLESRLKKAGVLSEDTKPE